MSTTTQKPLPCPRCGDSDPDVMSGYIQMYGHFVCCVDGCDHEGPICQGESAAVAAWNVTCVEREPLTMSAAAEARRRSHAVRDRRRLRRALRGGR